MEPSVGPSPSSLSPANLSCTRCFKRKVKCDRQRPCGACVRHNAVCESRPPQPSRPKKIRIREDILHRRLEQYEALLRQSGIDPGSSLDDRSTPDHADIKDASREPGPPAAPTELTPTSTTASAREYATPQLVYKHGRAQYVDNSLWTRVIEEMPDEENNLEYSSEGEDDQMELAQSNTDFVLGVVSPSTDIKRLHPPVEHISEMWQIFVENVNCLIKIVHEPTLELAIQRAAGDLNNVPRKLEALMFAIYAMAVISLKDSDCQEKFNESRQTLLARYRQATQVALSRANFLSSRDLMVFQAFLLHLRSVPDAWDPYATWTMMGLANRLAEGMGLHHDGTHLGLPPFETEIRRRLWWQMRMFDMHNAEVIGKAKLRNVGVDEHLPHAPANVNDDKLYPGMTTYPVETDAVSEMCFCSLQAQMARFWTEHAARVRASHGRDVSLWDNYESRDDFEEIERAVKELQELVENKYIRHSDPAHPVQLFTTLVARGGVNMMNFTAHHPRRWRNDAIIPDSERKYVWDLSIKMLEMEIMVRSSRQLERFSWHTLGYFPWAPVIHIFDTLLATPLMPESTKAWKLLDEEFGYREMVILRRKPVHIALGNLCLKAYNAREAALSTQGKPPERTPAYITKLRSQREAAKATRAHQVAPSQAQVPTHGSDQAPKNLTATSQTDQTRLGIQSNNAHPTGGTGLGDGQLGNTDPWAFSTGAYVNPEHNLLFPNNMAIDVEFLLEQGTIMGASEPQAIDWNQWDNLLRDWNGPFSST